MKCSQQVSQASAHGLSSFLKPSAVHMLGIGGIGMAGLATLLHQRGYRVSGSDLRENRQTARLREIGVRIQTDVPPDVQWMIRSTAVAENHPDVRRARVPVFRRGEVLAELLRDRFVIAVSGTHGKTTTTAMIAQILGCGYCIGGEIEGLADVARDDEIMAVEADESDGTVACYHPDIAVITNIEYDHMEHHADLKAFETCFLRFAANTKEKIVYCAGDPAAVRLFKDHPDAEPCSEAALGADTPVALPGRHNRLNAALAATVSRGWKPDAEIARALKTLRPVRRRFETVAAGDWTAVSDYAHHPSEIRALIETARTTFSPGRLLAVFQPHRYTRTRALLDEFPPAFAGVDKLWLVPVYAASETPLTGGTARDLLGRFSNDWKNRIYFFQSLEAAWQDIRRDLSAGDVLLIIGAGDIEQMGEWSKGSAAQGNPDHPVLPQPGPAEQL